MKKSSSMYQVNVTTKEGKRIPVGPMMDKREAPEEFAAVINKSVSEGKEKDWRDAAVVTIHRI